MFALIGVVVIEKTIKVLDFVTKKKTVKPVLTVINFGSRKRKRNFMGGNGKNENDIFRFCSEQKRTKFFSFLVPDLKY